MKIRDWLLGSRKRIEELKGEIRRLEMELNRLRVVEALAGRVVVLLNDGKVDYELVGKLEKLINARSGTGNRTVQQAIDR